MDKNRVIEAACWIAGRRLTGGPSLEIHNPYSKEKVGSVITCTRADTEQAIEASLHGRKILPRHERAAILEQARSLLLARRDDFATLIARESGLCLRETRYEVGRSCDVLRFAALESLKDDGEAFSGDTSPQGKPRRLFTLREPVGLAAAITPFNHPLNQVAHKVAPAIAAGTPMILKPSEKTPLTALRFAELLYEAGLPGPALSVLLGPTSEVAEVLVRDPRIDVVMFTGSVAVGKQIARTAGYKRLVLELGGNDPLIVFDDADLELAVTLAAEGAYRNSGQRCTAVKRILVQESIADAFTARLVEKTREYTVGDPLDPDTRVGTVIDEPAAEQLEKILQRAVAGGARILIGGQRSGAQFHPTVISDVPRDAEMVVCESFGPLAPILRVRDFDDAIEVANSTAYGLSAGVVTSDLSKAIQAVKQLRCGSVNINEVPGYRVENSPFGGIKDSGLGIKEGVTEAVKALTTVKTFSLPW